MRELEYPFDADYILKKKKSIKKALLAEKKNSYTAKNVAILGGTTTKDIKQMLEIFLLNYGFAPTFYESEFNQYYEDGRFLNPKLEEFKPDLVYICTSNRNISEWPQLSDSVEEIEAKIDAVYFKFEGMWKNLAQTYHCQIIQNNFEYPYFRILGNMDASNIHGRVNFVTRLNLRFYEYAAKFQSFYICDINYLSASYGLDRWSDPFYWHMYKYACAVPAIPYLSFNIANIIKSIYGKNKKVLNLDLDNTLWGGVVGDDGADNIEVGFETSLAQSYSEFQEYIKLQKQLGILLTINSKNDEENALAGLRRPDSTLNEKDFTVIKANWEFKSKNLVKTAEELNLLPESFVFVDDNPAERALIRQQMEDVAVPEMGDVEHYIQIMDKSGFFEATNLSKDDLNRNKMYQENEQRESLKKTFVDYKEYLQSLEMKAEIQSFTSVYMSRIAQLTNKSNQFNLTTRRFSLSDIEKLASDSGYLTLYGRLFDKFGDNGVVSLIVGRIDGREREELHLELWLMSCRVLKREMEYAMMDELVNKAKKAKIRKLVGYYFPTAKNRMVKDFYKIQGFRLVSEDAKGNTVWEFIISDDYQMKQRVIAINENGDGET